MSFFFFFSIVCLSLTVTFSQDGVHGISTPRLHHNISYHFHGMRSLQLIGTEMSGSLELITGLSALQNASSPQDSVCLAGLLSISNSHQQGCHTVCSEAFQLYNPKACSPCCSFTVLGSTASLSHAGGSNKTRDAAHSTSLAVPPGCTPTTVTHNNLSLTCWASMPPATCRYLPHFNPCCNYPTTLLKPSQTTR